MGFEYPRRAKTKKEPIAKNKTVITCEMFLGASVFFIVGFPILGIFILLAMMLNKLDSISRSNKLLLAYMVNPECMLEATNSDVVISNAMKAAKKYKGESAQVKEFFNQINPLIVF